MGNDEGAFTDYIIHMSFMPIHRGGETAFFLEMSDLRFHIVLFVC
jgi:hypothetical protein